MALTMTYDWDEKKQACERLHIGLKLPPGFPERYKKAVIRVMDLCAVKRHIMNPPEFILTAG
jgi:ribosomal protein S12 methylthiotransferase accessory factor